MVTVYIKKIEDFSETEKQNIISTLSDSAHARINKKRNEDLRLASLNALSLLTNEQRANLGYTESGRPYFSNLDADISISHSKTCVGIAISSSKNESVGIDIENKPMQNLNPSSNTYDKESTLPSLLPQREVSAKLTEGVPLRFLTEKEQIALANGVPYIEIWTKKEALFKYLKDDKIQFIHLDSTAPEVFGAKFVTVPADNNILTVCTKKDTKIEIIQK